MGGFFTRHTQFAFGHGGDHPSHVRRSLTICSMAGNSLFLITDAAGRTTSFQYDALGRRIGRTLPGGQTESFAYDLSGNVTNQLNFNGVSLTNQYDVMNRLTNCASVNGYHVSYAYNATNGVCDRKVTLGHTPSVAKP
jgi:YD repeat-containing protein